MSLLTAPWPAPPPHWLWLADMCRQFAATRLPLTPAPGPGSHDLNTGLGLVSTGHVTRMLVPDWSRVGPSQHRSQLWAEKRAPAEGIPVSIWAESGDHRVSKLVSARELETQLYRGRGRIEHYQHQRIEDNLEDSESLVSASFYSGVSV